MRSELGRIWPPPPLAGRGPPSRVRRRPPPLAGRVGAPHGANYDAYATLTGPTLRANLPPRRGGATIP